MAKTKESNGAGGLTRLARALTALPLVRDAIAERRAEVEAIRRSSAQALAAGAARRSGPESKQLRKALDSAQQAARAADDALRIAKDRERAALFGLAQLTSECDREIAQREAELVVTADPRIAEFVEQLFDDWTRMVNGGSHRGSFAPGAFAARMDALRGAIDEARALRLRADVDVARELARLVASVPAIPVGAQLRAPDYGAVDEDRALAHALEELSPR